MSYKIDIESLADLILAIEADAYDGDEPAPVDPVVLLHSDGVFEICSGLIQSAEPRVPYHRLAHWLTLGDRCESRADALALAREMVRLGIVADWWDAADDDTEV